jgi:2-succinyl-5-enolpyruvyl-6-hydroxy-3-cyclohexene-1-carboxylate synthase
LAQQSHKPTVLVCTSGTAAYNFAPSIAEAFFSHTPLIVFTADRPSEWIAQHDGQTIYQGEIYGKHVKGSYQLPQDYDHPESLWAINRIVNEAINLATQEPRGPVHINAPFREPLYPEKNESTNFSDDIRIIEHFPGLPDLTDEMKKFIQREWPLYKKVLVVAAQAERSEQLTETLTSFAKARNIPVVADIISNLHEAENVISHTDLFLGQAPDSVKKTLQPDLLITFGKSLISKNLKVFLRKYPAVQHWHVQAAGIPTDALKNLTQVFYTTEEKFFAFLNSMPSAPQFEKQKQTNYSKLWEVEERRVVRAISEFYPHEELSELEIVKDVLTGLPDTSILHLANSMSVRYANLVGLSERKKGIEVFSNRGTSGIDGCTSTAVGHALASDKLNVLITGDVAFFYDRNAFWHNYPLANIRVVVLNNHGGLIFNMIDGPASQPEAAEYFITKQQLKATKLCEEFGFQHLKIDNKRKIKNVLKDFFDIDGSTKILEVETDLQLNRNLFDNLKQKIISTYDI